MSLVEGKRILVVEDEALVAVMLADMLGDLGAIIVGPAGSIDAALPLATEAAVDVAVLDVNLRGERVHPVADALAARGIPFVLATGYGKAPDGIAEGTPVIDKPYTAEKLLAGLAAALAPSGGRG